MASLFGKIFQHAAEKKSRHRATLLGAEALRMGGYQHKNFKAAIDILDQGGDVNYIDETGTYDWDSNLGFYAIFQGADAVFNELLKRNLNPNLVNTLGSPLLCYAIKKGNSQIALALIEHGADITCVNSSYENPHMLARQNSMRHVLKAIEAKMAAGLNAKDDADKPASTFITIEVVRKPAPKKQAPN